MLDPFACPPLRRSGSSSISSYDDPPNAETDCTGTITYSSVLSTENTTEMMVTTGKGKVEAFEDDLQVGTPFAYRNVHSNELTFEYQKVQFKFRWTDDVTEEQRHALKYLLVFTPEDDPETSDDESEEKEILEIVTWDGQAAESQVFTVDPDTRKPNEDGRYALLPVDIDVIHPASGELSDSKEDTGDGGYVSIRRISNQQDLAPVTKLVIRAISGAQSSWKTRLKFTPGDRYKIYRDEARTQEVTSEQTEFDATQETTLYFQGLKKSQSRGGEDIKMQVGLSGQWSDGDAVKCTIVQSEFQIQVKAFIPYAWTEAETGTPFMGGKVAKGDNPDRSRGFKNLYSDRQNNYNQAPFRLMQKVALTPYEELHAQGDRQNERKAEAAILSEHYNKAASVAAGEQSQTYGYIPPSGAPTDSGEAEINLEEYKNLVRQNKESKIDIRIKGEDGALPWWTFDFPHDIEWNLTLKVRVKDDPLKPAVEVNGNHDRYPAYEVIIINSQGQFEDVHRHSPLATDHPGPISLDDDNAVDVEKEDTVND